MKRIGLLLFTFLLLFSPCFAQTDSGVRFSDLHGEVTVRPDTKEDAWELAEMASVLNERDHVKTEYNSGAILSMTDMTTFVMKPESEIVLSAPGGQDSKIALVAGNVWVNVKKMVTNGTMEIEMSQAVAGIKGTNITCSTSHGEDRIQVLRGIAEVLIKESREKVTVKEGEELVVKSGGKTEKVEIDVSAEQKKWEEATSRLGESIQLNEVPEVLKGLLDAETSEFSRLNEIFSKLIALEKVEAEETLILKRDAERFIGVLLEDSLVLNSIRRKIDANLASPDISASDRIRMVSLMKEVAAVTAKQQAFQAQIAKIMRYEFKLTAITEDISSELEMLRTELAQATADVDAVKAVLSANPTGQGQDWFKDASQICANALTSLDLVLEKTSELLTQNPTSVELMAIVKNINDQRTSISSMIRSLTVVEVPAATIVEMSQIDDVLSDNMVALQQEISAYNLITDAANVRASLSAMERRLKSSLQIMNSYTKVRRLYTNAQRLYDNTMKSTAGSAYRTSEQEELENTWQNISDRFQQLGIVAEQLQTNIQDLENQLSTFLK